MQDIGQLMKRLRDAGDIGEVLVSGWDAFELIQQLASRCTRGAASTYATWMWVIAPACEGRDTLAWAPSMPPGPQPAAGHPGTGPGEDDAARLIAGLAAALAARLRAAAIPGATPGDLQACVRAAHAAEEVRQLLSADGP